jgi:pre-mRNA-processing factor 19
MGCADGTIRVYDIRTGQLNGTLGPRPGAVKSIHFCYNGFWLAETSTEDSIVRIWDLRKATAVAHELQGSSIGGTVRWDLSGQFLALGGNKGVNVWAYQKKTKTFEAVTEEPLEQGGVKCFAWGLNGRKIVCAGLEDATVCVLGVEDA